MVDIEASGQAPGVGEMTHFGAVIVDKNLDKTFYGQLNGLDGTVNDHYRVDIIKPSHESIVMPSKSCLSKANCAGSACTNINFK
jgi:hypothetical protein